jgi:SAM-dependent methyltransferase
MRMNLDHHVNLLLRWDRGLPARDVISQVVQPGMSVMDAGCGTGIMGLWAAQAGASRVIGVDSNDVRTAELLAIENGLSEVFAALQRDLRTLSAEDAGGYVDVLIAFLYYNDPRRDEPQSRLVLDLAKRFLKLGGVCIPGRVRYSATPYHWPDQDISRVFRRISRDVDSLASKYGLTFQTLLRGAMDGPPSATWFPARDAFGRLVPPEESRPLAGPSIAIDVDYQTGSFAYPESIMFDMESKGIFSCVVWKQELCHGNRILFGNESISWVPEPLAVMPGDRVRVALDDQWRTTNRLDASPIL